MEPKPDMAKWKVFSGSMLKLLAVVCMVIDHGALIFAPVLPEERYVLLRKIGRVAFPVFCFLTAEGYVHTGNKKKYGLQLLLFALISEIPFDLMVSGKAFYTGGQNVYFTLFLGVLMLGLYDPVDRPLLRFLLMFAVGAAAVLLKVDYGIRGVLLIFLLYVLREQPVAKTALSYPLLSGGLPAFAAFLPINLYNGKRGFIQAPWLKYSFYVFYPVHMILLLAIKYAIR